ncbi:uncharacterized protein LOC127725561 [Mytilus californianus]|uniref:uncharacterized protein LOC127725561 n=1 Tax=Mytilus californianus TaxID=6549 RepID=UPI0022464579|nr:uncharacterized protein LOC127725561 [Mytilus californianus]
MADRKSNGDKTAPEFKSCPGIDEVPDFRAFMANPVFSPVLNYLQNENKEIIKQSRDSVRVFQKHRMCSLSMFQQYPDSPTANRYITAWNHFSVASQIFQGYKKDKVEDLKDCEILCTAFENIVHGYIYENSMFEPFRPPENTLSLIEQYLRFRPNDIFAEYVKVIIRVRAAYNPEQGKNKLLSDFESAKLRIKTSEMFASKLSLNIDSHPFQRRILSDVFYHLGANYVSTSQPERALDSFQKSYDLDDTNVGALYGIAYNYTESDPTKAIKLLLQYISLAPKCNDKYPNAYYMIASACVVKGNIQEAFRYCSLAEDAEKERLPFLPPVTIPQKTVMDTVKHMYAQMELLQKQKPIK